jgi:hypothetical protein
MKLQLNYQQKEDIMKSIFVNHHSPIGFRSVYKGIPIDSYDQIKEFIDFTKYFVMFRGPRRQGASSTRKCDAKAFDVYERDARAVRENRIEREAFLRGVQWVNNLLIKNRIRRN